MLAAELDKILSEGPGPDRGAARAEAENKVIEWALVKTEIVNAAYKLQDRRERIVLIDYYCNRMTVREIAADLEMSWRRTHDILKSAIKHIGEVLGLG